MNVHPFELAGMGTGPYKFVGIHDIRESREHAVRHLGGTHMADHPKVVAGMGTCCNCGHAINIVCIVESSDGRRWGVGSDCVLKTDDASLGDATKVAIAKRKKAIARAKAEAKRQAERDRWFALPSNHPDALTGETNGQFHARRQALQRAEQEAYRARCDARLARWESLAKELQATNNRFLAEMAMILIERPLSERQAFCVAKHFHKAGTLEHETLQHQLQQP